MLTISHLSKTYGSLEVLHNISLSIKKGEFVSLIGPSGCGKSTLFNIISGIEQETSGSISSSLTEYAQETESKSKSLRLRSGKNIFEKANRKGEFGYMLQKPLLLPFRTVLQNVMLGLEIKHIEKSKAKEKAQQLLEKFGLSEFANFYPNTLSGGMAQKVALLRTILFNNNFLLLDEPFGALDALTRISCQEWLLSVWEEYTSTVLFVTHDIREAIFLSDRILVMSNRPGKIIAEITVDLPRPRKQEYMASKKVLEMEKELISLLI